MAKISGSTREVTVIGAGIVGVACAINLQRDGHRVTLVDRGAPGEGTSSGNAGIMASGAVVPVMTPGIVWKAPAMLLDPMGPLSIRWGHLPRMISWFRQALRNSGAERVAYIADALSSLLSGSVEEHQSLARGTGAAEWLRPSPYLYVYQDEAALAKDAFAWDLRRKHGVRFRVLKGAALRELEPTLGPAVQCAVVLDDHGFIRDPLRLVKALAAHFAGSGGTILRCEVTDLEIGAEGSGRLVTDGKDLEFDDLVIAAGAWSGRLTALLGEPVPLESERGYHVTITNAGIAPRHPIMSAKGKIVVTPMEPGLRVAGLVEYGGLDAPPNYARTRILLAHARRLFPGIETGEFTEWMGHRPSLPDSLPVIGPSANFPRVFYAFGHQHVGMTGGPRTGRLIADLVAGRRPNINLAPFRIDRF